MKFKILNTDPIFCDSKRCYIIKNGYIFYHDKNHISRYAAKKVVQFIDNIYKVFDY